MRTLPVLVFIFFSAFEASGFILLESDRHESNLLFSHRGIVYLRSCGARKSFSHDLDDLSAESLLALCGGKTGTIAVKPVKESDYIESLQTLYRVPQDTIGIGAMSQTSIRRIRAERANEANTAREERLFQRLLQIASDFTDFLGPQSHRLLTFDHERALYTLAMDAMIPTFFDGSFFWQPLAEADDYDLDRACPFSWSVPSAQVVLESADRNSLLDWVKKRVQSRFQVMAWQHYFQETPVGNLTAYTSKERTVTLSLSDPVPYDFHSWLTGTTAIVCVRKFNPTDFEAPTEELDSRAVSLELYSRRWGFSTAGLYRRLASTANLDTDVYASFFWGEPLTLSQEKKITEILERRSGKDLLSVAAAEKKVAAERAKAEMRTQLKYDRELLEVEKSGVTSMQQTATRLRNQIQEIKNSPRGQYYDFGPVHLEQFEQKIADKRKELELREQKIVAKERELNE